ncbi:MAG: SDR family oxidoreductase [Firmicutes bacterium]|nr:SDR family oxidoreductase [Bacillota bacterium]
MILSEVPIAIVTGGSSGIGHATVERLRANDIYVIVLDLREPPVGSFNLFIPCDVSNEAQVKAAVEKVGALTGRVNVLVNCAGIIERAACIEEIELQEFDRVAGVNLKGPLIAIKYAVPFMKSAGGGAIVNISSIVGLSGAPAYPIYAATKGGLIVLGLSLARALAPFNIRVNTICPGSVKDTKFIIHNLGRELQLNERLSLIKKIPLRQVACPDDIAQWVAFLCSPASGTATGAVITVDGAEMWGT